MKAPKRGFSTLEAIAAVAIVGVALVPIFTLQAQLARSHARQLEATARHSAVENALAVLAGINPMQSPQGSRDLGGVALVWRSAPISPLRASLNPPGFEVRLYRVTAELHTRKTPHVFTLDMVGWRKLEEK